MRIFHLSINSRLLDHQFLYLDSFRQDSFGHLDVLDGLLMLSLAEKTFILQHKSRHILRLNQEESINVLHCLLISLQLMIYACSEEQTVLISMLLHLLTDCFKSLLKVSLSFVSYCQHHHHFSSVLWATLDHYHQMLQCVRIVFKSKKRHPKQVVDFCVGGVVV